MKAAVFYGPGDMRIEEREIPVPGPGQMVVRINYCGICGTDIESFKTDKMIPPGMVYGHENVGTVSAIGEGVNEFEIGDRVLCGPPTHCAEDCSPCRDGRSNICIHGFMRTAGLRTFDGGYAEYMLINDAAHTMLIKLPENADLKEAVLFDVVCVALHAIRRSAFRIGDNVVVSGTGAIGLSAVRLLKAAGANKIVALGTTTSKFDLIKSFGADYCINPNETEDLKAELLNIFGRDVAADVAFECVGSPSSLANIIYSCVKPGGQVMLVGTGAVPLDTLYLNRIIPKELDLNTSFVYTPDEVKAYLEMLDSGKLSFSDLVTDVIALEDCVEKGLARKDRRGQIKILIDPSMKGGE